MGCAFGIIYTKKFCLIQGHSDFLLIVFTVFTLTFRSMVYCELKKNFIYFYFWLCWVFIAVHRLSLVGASGGHSLLWCTDFSLRCLLLLRSTGSRHVGFSSCDSWASVVVARGLSSCGLRALERRLSSCGARASLLCGMWDLPRPGLEPVSPALAGGFLTTAPSGKPYCEFSLIYGVR